ncbi:MAG TPA: type I methionyl aminopeptidase [Candidatus Saccharimonadales bacterium]|nr:type I methionyl aminopeptidase [Candidatus Saccharimonadales bacterium]
MKAQVKTEAEIAAMRHGGRILATVLQNLSDELTAGMTTLDLDELATSKTQALGGSPAFLGHEGFPKSICVSVNDEIVHGIPGRRVLVEGDIVGLDFGVRYQDMITDSAVTVAVGAASGPSERLLKATREALYAGIDQATAGCHVGDIAAAVEQRLRAANLGIIQELAGHGVGRELWEEPQIPNLGTAGSGTVLTAGMTVAIEPMATLGNPAIQILDDNWTIVTRDGSLAAQFEHTILVTDGVAEILTQL